MAPRSLVFALVCTLFVSVALAGGGGNPPPIIIPSPFTSPTSGPVVIASPIAVIAPSPITVTAPSPVIAVSPSTSGAFRWTVTLPLESAPGVTTSATGQAVLSYTPSTQLLEWTVTHTIADATVSHIHSAAGAVLITLTNTATSPFSGSAILTTAQRDGFCAGGTYVNVHSSTNGNGELQVRIYVNCADGTFNYPASPITAQVPSPATITVVPSPIGSAPSMMASPSSSVYTWMFELAGASSFNTGSATFTYDPTTMELTWLITHNISDATMAHIHDGVGAVSLSLSSTGTSPITGSAILTTAQVTAFCSGEAYVNVHSTTVPAGELQATVLANCVDGSYILAPGASPVVIDPPTLASPSAPVGPVAPGCGNGIIDAGEDCDGGASCLFCKCPANFFPDKKTPPGCAKNCGNAKIDLGEQCDSGPACLTTCRCPAGCAATLATLGCNCPPVRSPSPQVDSAMSLSPILAIVFAIIAVVAAF